MVDLLLRWGADEKALNNDCKSLSEFLDVCRNVSNPDMQGEVERTRLLLARAPADRAWRRQGWLVMLRSRGSEARTATSRDGADESGGGSSSSGGAESDAHGKVGAGGGTDDKGEVWSGVVELLLVLEVEGVFRTVVGFS